ncbi:MAG: STAS domain-containing protein [Micrococcales bacterium]|nr:STAS domain-containing protein [Micrococcales bacterium]
MSDLRTTAPDRIGVDVIDGDTVVSLVGEIDADLRGQASDCMGIALMHGLPIVVDAEAATFVDSAGVAFVLQLYMAAREAGIPMTLHDPHGTLRDVLAVVRQSAGSPGHDEHTDDDWD